MSWQENCPRCGHMVVYGETCETCESRKKKEVVEQHTPQTCSTCNKQLFTLEIREIYDGVCADICIDGHQIAVRERFKNREDYIIERYRNNFPEKYHVTIK